jgi:hypothetical protein
VPLLWRRWSPGYGAAEDLRHVDAAIVESVIRRFVDLHHEVDA